MTLTVKLGFPVILRGLLAILLVGTMSVPCGAQGFKERLKNTFGKKSNRSEENQVPGQPREMTTPNGMRNVLLVSKPKHGGKIPRNSTIAFIKFEHIEDDVWEKEENSVCAAQVASSLAQHLSDLNEYKIVTRDRLESVLTEQRVTNSGSFNSATAAKLGELTGADILIYGQVQLCVPGLEDAASEASQESGDPEDGQKAKINLGPVKIPIGGKKEKEKVRSYVIAHIELIDSDTGDQVFTVGLRGNFEYDEKKEGYKLTDRELISRAADNLANVFVDNFLARREPLDINLYVDPALDLGRGIDFIQLGDCTKAEAHFRDVYTRHKHQMSDLAIAKVMYNHGIALMCSNRSEEAEARLWASLRLLNDPITFYAIAVANDTIDRGREIMVEEDPIIRDVLAGLDYRSTNLGRESAVDTSDFVSSEQGGR